VEELRFLKVGQEDLVQVLKLHGRKLRKHHISEELPAVVDAEPADVNHRLEQACTVELVKLGPLMHEELKENTAFLGGHISGYVLLDELQAEDRQARVSRRLGDEVKQDFYQVEPELIIRELLVTVLANIVGCQNEVLMLHI
jgi:hypothetical protein